MTETEERYNNRQIEKMMDDQTRDIKEHFSLLISPLTTQVTMTNGTVKWQTKLLYTGLGALLLLVPWAGWVTTSLLQRNTDVVTQEDLDRAVNITQENIDKAVNDSFERNLKSE